MILGEFTPKLIAAAEEAGLGMELPYNIADLTSGKDAFLANMLLGSQVDLDVLNKSLIDIPYKIRTV